MIDITSQLTEALINHQNVDDLFKQLLEEAINQILKDDLLPNKFNSFDNKDKESYKLNTSYGSLDVLLPSNSLVDKTAGVLNLESTIIQLLQNGISFSEVSNLLEKMYGYHYIPQTNSSLEHIQEDGNSEKEYMIMLFDSIKLPVKLGKTVGKFVYFIIGIRSDGIKEILHYHVFNDMSDENWYLILKELEAQGVEETDLAIVEDKGEFRELIRSFYPNIKYQQNCVYVENELTKLIEPEKVIRLRKDFKRVYQAKNYDDGVEELAAFINKWNSQYPEMHELLKDPDLLTFYHFPEPIWSTLYSLNLSKRFGKMIKRKLKNQKGINSRKDLKEFLEVEFSEANTQFSERIHRGFNEI